MKRILIAGGGTGGHLMPALAIAQTLVETAPGFEPVLVGAARGVEARLLPTRDFRFHLLPSEPIYRRTWWKNVRWPIIAGHLLRRVGRVFADEQPVAVVGTGGYASAPVVWWATRRRVPTAIQEQNAYPGLATRLLSTRVRHVYLGLPEARALLRFGRHTQVFDTGNPITPPTPGRRAQALARFGLTGSRPVVLVTGGSQGALAINRAVAGWLDQGGPRGADLLWVTGRGTYDQFAARHRPPAVQVIDFLDPMADGYAVADVVVSRAGMITVAELCAWGLPSVLVPLPTAAADHQTHNARVLAEAGASALITQTDLTAATLAAAIESLLGDRPRRETMAARALARGRPHAAADIVSKILTLAS
ncbi:MAG TPA: UDP-N-acetylglucosamine--N-acetylmuramyl-(pentapeptide) pyrophosphoryl-undecaprenol N-acetylglucosamine transferase [Gemmatimonadales bacterium]|nr:UDP-N-acetylglucosamine--N-acetylmuramyl-(pentapeptide) pyrophosphoryl-undecaprenol N-acetylglucosamine transferase [Gemmatimonadales bacterium]